MIKESAIKAKEVTAGTKTTTELLIITRTDAMDGNDRKNQLIQAVIGAKEGATATITRKVGARVTNAILHTADDTDFKSINEYELHELVAAAIQTNNCPRVRVVRQQLIATISL